MSVKCNNCYGSGAVKGSRCPECKGTRLIPEYRATEIRRARDAKIPKCRCGNNLSKDRQDEGIDVCPACEVTDKERGLFEWAMRAAAYLEAGESIDPGSRAHEDLAEIMEGLE